MTFPAGLYTHVVSVQTLIGQAANGPVFADPVDQSCVVQDATVLRESGEVAEMVSDTRIVAGLSALAVFTPGSKVTIGGSTSRVQSAVRRRHPMLSMLDHVGVVVK